MANHYVTRDRLKHALGIPADSTNDDPLVDAAIDGVSREIDKYLGFALYPAIRTRRFRTAYTDRLYLYPPMQSFHAPLLSLITVRVDPGGDTTFETTYSTADFVLRPFNAPTMAPSEPYWEIWARSGSTASFPPNVEDAVEVIGTFGYFDLRDNTTATPTSGHGATDTTITITGATSLHPGQTILMGAEQLFIREINLQASGIIVDRGVNGTTATTHSSATSVQIYRYDEIERLALYQAGQDFRWTPSGAGAGGGILGSEPPAAMVGGLHPFVRRRLDMFREPIAR